MNPAHLPRLAALCLLFAAPAAFASGPGTPLFNGRDLTGWIVHSRDAAAPSPWSVADGVIKCTGMPAGYIRTTGRHQDYHLTVEWRWTGPALPPDSQGRPRNRNSGVLLHTQEPDNVWPKSIEAQLMENNAGDFWCIGGVDTAEHAAVREKALAAAGADEEARKRAAANRRLPRRLDSSEKPAGEWNTYDIICRGDTVTLRVNGVEQNRVTGLTVREGHICLQSEGAPIEFRNVKLVPLN
jgi:hypothetical protein